MANPSNRDNQMQTNSRKLSSRLSRRTRLCSKQLPPLRREREEVIVGDWGGGRWEDYTEGVFRIADVVLGRQWYTRMEGVVVFRSC